MHLLVAFEDEYRVYQDVIVSTISILRPHVEVSLVDPGVLEEEVSRLCPHLVISSRPRAGHAGSVLAWLRAPTGPHRSAELWRGEERGELLEVGLEALLRIVDETEMLEQERSGPGS